MSQFLDNSSVESDLRLKPAPLAPAKRVRVATALAPSRSTTVNNKDSLRKLYRQKSTLNRAIENTIDDYAGLGSALPTVGEMEPMDPLMTMSVIPRPLAVQTNTISLKDELTRAEQEDNGMDTEARALASTYQTIHRIEKELELSQLRRKQRTGKKHELTASADAHKNATAYADSGATSNTVKAAYTPHQAPTVCLDEAIDGYRITYPVHPRRFSDAISPKSLTR